VRDTGRWTCRSLRPGRSGWLCLLLAFWFGVVFWGAGAVTPLAAQDEELLGEWGEEETTGEGESATSSSGAAASATEGDTRTLLDIVKSGGLVGLLIMLLSIVAVGFIVEHLITIRKGRLLPEDVLADLEQMIARGEIREAIEYCDQQENESLAADVISAGLRRYTSSEFGFAEYKSAVEEAGEDHTGRLYRKIDVLGVIGAIAPMLGLTGTVLGMIKAFNKLAALERMAKPAELAEGIGQALVTTLMGLVVAIPAMVAYSYFRNRIDSLVSEGGKRVEQVMAPLGRQR
jgi:biopolymer transport protein ExbB